jgi:late competence protein required for DNA uptake (superfamily II DNA/RNA helicase)
MFRHQESRVRKRTSMVALQDGSTLTDVDVECLDSERDLFKSSALESVQVGQRANVTRAGEP